MQDLRHTQKEIVKYVILFNMAAGLAGSIIIRPIIPYLTGLLFGTLISLLNFRLLYLTLDRAVTMTPGKAQKYVTARYLVRYALIAAVLLVSIKSTDINALGTVIGLLMIKPVILKQNLFNDPTYFKNIFSGKEEK